LALVDHDTGHATQTLRLPVGDAMNPFQRSIDMRMPLVSPNLVYDVSQTIEINIGANADNIGLIGPAVLNSKITDGSPVLRVLVNADGVNLTNLLLEKIQVNGNGREGDGIVISCPTNNSWVYRSVFRDLAVSHCGGNGIVFDGSVFESSIHNCWAADNKGNGFVFRHNNGGQVSAISMHGGGARKNLQAGIALLDGARDIKMFGLYFCENAQFGVNADQGCTLLSGCGFENNQPSGLRYQNFANLMSCTFSTHGVQNPAIQGYLAGGSSIINTGNEDYGGGQSVFAKLDGNGTVALINSQPVDASSGVTVKELR
jgi:hypothetical protein